MNTLQFFTQLSSISWKIQKSEMPLKVFLSTFAIRIFFQVLFFTWVVNVVGGKNWMDFALYGNILLPAISFLFVDVYNVIRDEIEHQRLELLICSRSNLLSILVGRTIGYIFKATLIMIFSYCLMGLLLIPGFQHWLNFLTALPLLIIIVLSAYSVAVFFSSFNLNEKIGAIIPNTVVLLLMFLGNFTIPVNILPNFLQICANFLPLYHGVNAFRNYLTTGTPYWTNPDLYWELLVLMIYLLLGYGIYLYSIKKSRKNPIIL